MKTSKILIFFLCFLFVFSYFNVCVQAYDTVDEDGFRLCEQYVKMSELDESTNTYTLDYVCYNSGGRFAGSLKIPVSLYNQSHFVVLIDIYGSAYLIHSNNSILYRKSSILYFTSNSFGGTVYKYSDKDEGFTYVTPTHSTFMQIYQDANSFVYLKDMQVKFIFSANGKDIGLAYSYFRNNQVLVCPALSYLVSAGGFRFFLQGFVDKFEEFDLFTVSNVVTSIELTVKDINEGTYLLENYDIFNNYDTSSDAEGRTCIDILFSDLLPDIKNKTTDYMVTFKTTLSSNKTYSIDTMSNIAGATVSSGYTEKTTYVSIENWKFSYNKDKNSGMLFAIGTDGTELPSGGLIGSDDPTPPDNPDDPEEKDPNAGVINAIDGLGSSIENQTEAIKENTETNKNIFQKLLDLPRGNYRTFA